MRFVGDGYKDREAIAKTLQEEGYHWSDYPGKNSEVIVAAVLQKLLAGLAIGSLEQKAYEAYCVAGAIVDSALEDGLILESEQ